jgi:hypothetical protein
LSSARVRSRAERLGIGRPSGPENRHPHGFGRSTRPLSANRSGPWLEVADTPCSRPGAARRAGSTPAGPTSSRALEKWHIRLVERLGLQIVSAAIFTDLSIAKTGSVLQSVCLPRARSRRVVTGFPSAIFDSVGHLNDVKMTRIQLSTTEQTFFMAADTLASRPNYAGVHAGAARCVPCERVRAHIPLPHRDDNKAVTAFSL